MESPSADQWAVRPLKKYAVFSGRAPRAEFWWFYLATFIVSRLLAALDRLFGTSEWIETIFSAAILVPSVAVAVRRLHDVNRSGWWNIAPLLPLCALVVFFPASFDEQIESGTLTSPPMLLTILCLAALLLLIVAWAMPGTKGSNRYGPDPYTAPPTTGEPPRN